MNKPLALLLLISSTAYPSCNKQELVLKQQQEKDQQEYRMEQLKVVSMLSLAVIAALVKIYYQQTPQN